MTTTLNTTAESKQGQSPLGSTGGRHRQWWQWLRIFGEFLLLFVLAISLLELLFKITGVGEEEYLQPDPTFGCIHIPNKLVTWRLEGYSREKISSQGWRDIDHAMAKPAGVIRIALLGDSTTEALQVPLAQTFGQVLERDLERDQTKKRIEVLNFGCASYSTGQELLTYKEKIRQYHPDIVILLYNRGDSVENVFVPQSAERITPRPYFYLEPEGKTGQIKLDPSVLNLHADLFRPHPFMSFLREHSRIYGVFSQQNLMLSINEPLYSKIKRFIMRLPFSGCPKQATAFIRPAYPLQDPLKVTIALLKQIHQEVQADGGKFLLVLFPNCIGDPEYATQQKALAALSQKDKIDFIDLTEPFNKSARPAELFLQYHLSSKGHQLVADQLKLNLLAKSKLSLAKD